MIACMHAQLSDATVVDATFGTRPRSSLDDRSAHLLSPLSRLQSEALSQRPRCRGTSAGLCAV